MVLKTSTSSTLMRRIVLILLAACAIAGCCTAIYLVASVPDGTAGHDLPDGVKAVNIKSPSEYVQPNGDGAIDRSSYATDKEYLNAVAESMKDEVEVPRNDVELSEYTGFTKGIIHLRFERSAGEEAARATVSNYGGIWVNGEFAVKNGSSTAAVEAYFPELSKDSSHEGLEAKCRELRKVKGVYSAEWQDSYGAPSSTQYYLSTCHFKKAWSMQKCNGNARIAVLDTGIQCSHEDLASNISFGYDAVESEFGLPDPKDAGHGTTVSGVACASAGNGIGVDGASYNAELVPVQVSHGKTISWSNVIKALSFLGSAYLTGYSPDVANMSFEFPSLTDAQIDEGQEKVTWLHNHGVVCIAAVGNLRKDQAITDFKYPAALDDVIGVGSVSENLKVSDFSHHNSSVDICAPGENIYSTFNSLTGNGELYGKDSGTSFAAPQVAAAAALLSAKYPAWAADKIENRLESTAKDLGKAGYDTSYGHGLLNTAAALRSASPETGGSAYELALTGL